MRRLAGAACLCIAAAGPVAKACDVALVLAIDVSGSVDPAEYRLQSEGLAGAFADTTVRQALIDAEAMVSVLQWSGSGRQHVSVPWTVIGADADIDRLARAAAEAPRAFRNFATGIGDALAAAAALLGEVPARCAREVIDVSGDGRSNEGRDVRAMRDALVRAGVQINGLAIETGDGGLTDYYRREVIGGGGTFVMTARDFEDYPRAIRRKLLRELTEPVAEAPSPGDRRREAADCETCRPALTLR